MARATFPEGVILDAFGLNLVGFCAVFGSKMGSKIHPQTPTHTQDCSIGAFRFRACSYGHRIAPLLGVWVYPEGDPRGGSGERGESR